MRVLYVDIDSLRPDHLGCYGYGRDTSPNIDAVAEDGRRFTNYYASDLPCLPSRTALFTSRFGFHTGVVNHGGTNADVRHRGADRGFNTGWGPHPTWPSMLRRQGMDTAFVSPFPQRHGAWHVLDGFEEWVDTGGGGREEAHVVYDEAADWLDAHATEDDWYLHVNFWDPHTPYSTPLDFDPDLGDGRPDYPDEETIRAQYEDGYGPFSARDLYFYGDKPEFGNAADERMPAEIADRADFEQYVDGYDVGIRYADRYVGKLLDLLRDAGVYEDTLVVVTADHGESMGEFNTYGDHVTADESVARVPLVVSGPGVEPGVDDAFRYQVDLAPTVTELAGGDPPDSWDGESFATALSGGGDGGRDFLVLSMGAWSCQRAVRWDDWLLVRTYHDSYNDLPPVHLFDVSEDPHETENLARDCRGVVEEGLGLLESWLSARRFEAARGEAGGNPGSPRAGRDPLWEVMAERGPHHPRGNLEEYVARLRETGREDFADRLAAYEGVVTTPPSEYLD